MADNWRPLFAIADIAGGIWSDHVRTAALAQLAGTVDDEIAVLLLADIREIFDRTDTAEVSSTQLCEGLAARDDRPWPELSRGRPITPRKLASLLAPFGIRPVHREQFRGYRRADFEEAWARYLPEPRPSPGTNEAALCQDAHGPDGSTASQSVRSTITADTSDKAAIPAGRRVADGRTLRNAQEEGKTEDTGPIALCPSCGGTRWWRTAPGMTWRCWRCEPSPPAASAGFEVVVEALGA